MTSGFLKWQGFLHAGSILHADKSALFKNSWVDDNSFIGIF
jgi:hypothetical protein